MSLERRIAQMRTANSGEVQPHTLIASALKKDREALFAHFKQGRGTQVLDDELIDVYELRPAEIPTLVLPNNLSFVSGFSYVASHWYPLVRAVASGAVAVGEEQFMDSHLAHMFPDSNVTTQQLRDELAVNLSGATWLEQMTRVTFRLENLELLGATKAISGSRRMYEQLTANS